MSEQYIPEKIEEGGKEVAWNNRFREVQMYRDGAGNKMDEGIIETVIALNVNGIDTIQSCSGHIDKGMMPWVHIKHPGEPKRIYKKSDITPEWEQWHEGEKALEERVEQLLEEFYSGRETKSGITLKLEESKIGATSKEIEALFADDPYGIKVRTKQEESELDAKLIPLIPLAQEEMRAFTLFLKEKFFEAEK